MAFFTGEHECKLDAKGRLVLPSRLKSVLPSASKNSIVVRKGFEPNLIIYPLSEFQNIYARINSLNEFSSEQRRLKRNLFSSISQVELDSNGRLVVTGVGKSANIARKLVATFNSTGQSASFMHAGDAIHGDLEQKERMAILKSFDILTNDTVMVVISISLL